MRFKKNYLTIEEIGNIIEEMRKEKDSYIREMIKVSMVAQYCLDIKFEADTTLNQIYNQVAEDGILEQFDSEIHNYYRIDKLIKEELGIEKMILIISDIMKKMEDINLDEIIGKNNDAK